jgi:methionine-rich copper-binding protein CopC
MSYTQIRAAGLTVRPASLALAVAAALALLMAISATRVSAHAAYDHSTPADGEVVAESPAQIQVFFKQEVTRSGGLPTLEVVNDSGDLVSSNAVLNDDDRTEMTADLNPGLPDGRYAILWHTVSAEDGEEAKGAVFFHVGEGPSVTTPGTGGSATATPALTASPAPTAEDDDGGDIPVWALIAGVAGGLVLGGGSGLLLGRRR